MTLEERRKNNSASFEVADMNIQNEELKCLAYQIQISFMNLEKNMVSKEDIKDISDKMIAIHGNECPVKNMKLLTVENMFPYWKECNEKHKEETYKKFDTWTDRAKRSAGWLVALGIVLYNINWSAIIDAIK